MTAHARRRQQLARASARRLDHAANALAMADLRAKAEIARGGLDIDRPARGLRLAGIDLEPHRLAGGRRTPPRYPPA